MYKLQKQIFFAIISSLLLNETYVTSTMLNHPKEAMTKHIDSSIKALGSTIKREINSRSYDPKIIDKTARFFKKFVFPYGGRKHKYKPRPRPRPVYQIPRPYLPKPKPYVHNVAHYEHHGYDYDYHNNDVPNHSYDISYNSYDDKPNHSYNELPVENYFNDHHHHHHGISSAEYIGPFEDLFHPSKPDFGQVIHELSASLQEDHPPPNFEKIPEINIEMFKPEDGFKGVSKVKFPHSDEYINSITSDNIYRHEYPNKGVTNTRDKIHDDLDPAGIKGLDPIDIDLLADKLKPYLDDANLKL